MDQKLAYTIKEAAAQTGLGPRTIWTLIERNELVSIKPSGLHVRLIRHDDLVAYLARQPPVPAGAAD